MGDSFCVKVHVPNSGDALRALLSSLMKIATWVSWERDGEGTAARMAQLWKASNELTFQGIGTHCDDCPECYESVENCTSELQSANRLLNATREQNRRLEDCIEKLEDSIMCILCNTGCGNNITPPLYPPPTPSELLPKSTVTGGDISDFDEACRTLQYFLNVIAAAALEIINAMRQGQEVLEAKLEELTQGDSLLRGAAIVGFRIWLWVAGSGLVTPTLLSDLHNAWSYIQENIPDVVHAMLCDSLSTSLEEVMLEQIMGVLVGAPSWYRFLLTEIVGLFDWEAFVDIAELSLLVPAEFEHVPCDCSGTGEPSALPELPAGYFYVPFEIETVIEGSVTDLGGGTLMFDGDRADNLVVRLLDPINPDTLTVVPPLNRVGFYVIVNSLVVSEIGGTMGINATTNTAYLTQLSLSNEGSDTVGGAVPTSVPIQQWLLDTPMNYKDFMAETDRTDGMGEGFDRFGMRIYPSIPTTYTGTSDVTGYWICEA